MCCSNDCVLSNRSISSSTCKQLLSERCAPCQGLDVMCFKLQGSSQNKNMSGNKDNSAPVTHRTRLERLLRDRELRKFNRNVNQTEELSDGVKEAELSAKDSVTEETETCGPLHEEASFEGVDVCERPRCPKQRLMVTLVICIFLCNLLSVSK